MAAERPRGDERESGFVLVVTVVFTATVLMVMAAFAVDVGAWYSRAGQIQRAADAAALAGVVYMPNNFDRAQDIALETAKKNGFADADPGVNPGNDIDIVVEPVPATSHRLKVTIYDRKVETYFGKAMFDSIAITRSAIAHFAEPIPLGSAENHFGIGPADANSGNSYGGGPMPTQNFFVAINGQCSAAEDGDMVMSRFDGNADPNNDGQTTDYACTSTEVNPAYDADGYVYIVELPQAPTSPVNVDVWDPAFNPYQSPAPSGPGWNQSFDYALDGAWDVGAGQWDISTTDLDTIFQVRAPDTNGTPLNFDDDAVIATQTILSKQAGLANQWVTIATIPAGPQPGVSYPAKYRVHVRTDATRNNSWGVNVFAMRADVTSQGGRRCTTLGSAVCPSVHGENRMSVWVNRAGSSAELYLAKVEEVHAGKRLVVDLWDPGEGSRFVEILQPRDDGTWDNATFSWEVVGTSAIPGESNVTRLNLTQPDPSNCPPGGSTTYVQPGPNPRAGKCRFNDRRVRITVDIPMDYAISSVNQGWWKIKYTTFAGSGTTVTDRTTWQIAVEGDPVHLVEN